MTHDIFFHCIAVRGNHVGYADQLQQHSFDKRWVVVQILRMRYGLHRPDGQGMTLSDVSAAYGITKERIRQLEELAMYKLRRHKDVLTDHLTTAGARFGDATS